MEILRLPEGKAAAIDVDCVGVTETADHKFQLTASVLDKEESVSIIADVAYDSADEAEAAGIAWAEAHGVQKLYVSRNA